MSHVNQLEVKCQSLERASRSSPVVRHDWRMTSIEHKLRCSLKAVRILKCPKRTIWGGTQLEKLICIQVYPQNSPVVILVVISFSRAVLMLVLAFLAITWCGRLILGWVPYLACRESRLAMPKSTLYGYHWITECLVIRYTSWMDGNCVSSHQRCKFSNGIDICIHGL